MTRPAVERGEFRHRADRGMLVLYASVIESLGWATAALLDQDAELASRVIADDREVDQRCSELAGRIKARLGETTVDPAELEDLVAILQMVSELERSADLAEHIAQRGIDGLGGAISPRARGFIQSMCDVGIRMWQLASRAYAERSRDLSFEINEADDELDTLSAALLREGAEGGVEPAVAAELALVARFYERIGDHAVNLARRSAAMVAPKRMAPLHALAKRRGRRGARSNSARSAWSRLRHPRLAPGDERFFELFEASASNAHDAADELHKMIASFSDLSDFYREIRAYERRGDQITVELLRLLDASVVTPYDREDIHALAEELDDVVDDIFSVAEFITLFKVSEAIPELLQQGDNLATMAAEMEALVRCLRNKEGARHRLERIEALEREGDALYRRSIARLFSGEFEALEVLKWKDIVHAMENAMNRVEDISDVIESILVKNS